MSRESGPYPTGDAAERFLRAWRPPPGESVLPRLDREAAAPHVAAIAANIARIGEFVAAHPHAYWRAAPETARSLTLWRSTSDAAPLLTLNSYAENGVAGLGTGRILLSHGLTPGQQRLPRQLGIATQDRLQLELHTDPSTMDQAHALASADPAAVWHFSTFYYFDQDGHAGKVVALPSELADGRPALGYGRQTGAKLVAAELTRNDVELAGTAVLTVLRKLGLAPPQPRDPRT